MKFALCLALCFGLALATVDQWRWTETFDDILDTENYYGREYGMSLGDKKICRIGSRTLKTFEEDVKEISLPTAFKTVLKDCSTSYPRYAVLVRKLKPFSDLKIVKVATRTNNILLVPVSEFDDQVRVIVDGRRRLINRNIEVIPTTEQDIKLVKIGSVVKVILPTNNLVVEFDGRTCNVKVPTTFTQEHCGVCSTTNYETDMYTTVNDDLNNEFTTECFLNSECALRDETEFLPFTRTMNTRCSRRNLFNTLTRREECTNTEDLLTTLFDNVDTEFLTTLRPMTTERRTFLDMLENNQFVTPFKKQTVMRRRMIRTDGQVCLSVQRVPQCPVNTFPQNEVETRVTYKCVVPEPRLVQKLVYRLRNGQRVSDLTTVNTVTRVEVVPTTCQQNF